MELLLQGAVEAQDVAVALVVFLVALLDSLPQQSQLPLHSLQPLQVDSRHHHRGEHRLRMGKGVGRNREEFKTVTAKTEKTDSCHAVCF